MATTQNPATSTELSDAKRALLRTWMRGGAPRTESEAIPARDPGSDAPLSFAQQRLWFLDQLVPGSPAYNIPVALRLRGALDARCLQAALSEVVARHEVLRTTFPIVDGEPVQRVSDGAPVRLEQVVLSGTREEQEAALRREVDAEARQPFDLTADRPMRQRLLALVEREHILLLTWSHMVADGWSATVFSRELSAIYRALVDGREHELSPPGCQYGDFAAWQRGWLQGERLEAQVSWWRERLAGADGVLDLPTDRPRPVVQAFRGDAVPVSVPEGLPQRLRELARSHDATLFQCLLAAFKALLLRHSGDADLLVGTPIANRQRAELEQAIGFFANTLVLRTDLSGDPTFAELLGRVRETAQGAYANQDVPFEKLVDELVPDRNLSHNPLFQVMFVLNNMPAPEAELAPGLTMEHVATHAGTAKFDLWLSLQELGDDLAGVLEYNSDLFERATVVRMLDQFVAILQTVVEHPDRPLARLLTLAGEERRRTLVDFNRTATSYDDGPQTLIGLVEAQVDRTPDAVALRFEGEDLSFGALDERANRLAHRLLALGAGPEQLIGICAHRSLELVVGLLAILKSGAAYVPIDPDHPADRVAYLLEDSGVDLLLCQRDVEPGLPPYAGAVVHLDDPDGLAAMPAARPAVDVRPEHLAYMIYTSGSTGRPKGAMNEHRAIVNRLRWMQDEYGLQPDDSVLQKTPVTFDVSAWEFFWPLATGARLVIARPDGHRDPRYLTAVVEDEQITMLHFVPSMLRVLLDEAPQLGGWRAVRRVLCSGEALGLELQERYFERMDCELHNLYGPTEAAIDVTSWACERGGARASVPIGRPIANIRIYMLDERCEPVPIGVLGRLYIGGVGVGRGYHGQPALTAERFVPDPYGHPGERLYDTGDIARWLADGAIEFLGRADDQIKLNGVRIEPGEIEAALRGARGVRDAAVLARRVDGGDALVAYVARDAAADGPAAGSAQVDRWADVFDDAYAPAADRKDGAFDIAGWASSYTGEPLPATEMRAWVDQTVQRIRDLEPRRVLEVGVGTGLILFGVAPHVDAYHGIDVSATGLAGIERELHRRGAALSRVTLEQRAAHDLHELASDSVDCVVLNSVAQYFPNADYLLAVLRECCRVCADGGSIFVGDVRSLRLLEAFAASVECHQAGDEMAIEHLRRRVAARAGHEAELIVDPALFAELSREIPAVADARVLLKGKGYDNELSRYRYDAVLRVGPAGASQKPAPAVDWQAVDANIDGLVEHLLEEQPESLVVENVPDVRLDPDAHLLAALADDGAAQTAGELRDAQVRRPGSVDPQRLEAMVSSLGYRTVLRPAAGGQATSLDAVLWHADAAAPLTQMPPRTEPYGPLTNRPQDERMLAQLAPHWRSELRQRLPDNMVPARFVLVDELPLSPNGKLDRDRLPAPLPRIADPGAVFVAPRDRAEHALADIWAAVLGLDAVGVQQNYFQLGGDSIRGIQIVSQANAKGLDLKPRDLFQHPTIAELAAAARARPGAEAPASTTETATQLSVHDGAARDALLEQPDVEAVGPLAPYQGHMLAHQLAADPGSGSSLVQRMEHLRGAIDDVALARAWRRLPAVFPILRTSFRWEDLDEPLQVVHREASLPFAFADWRGVPEAQRGAQLQSHLADDRARGCDPGTCAPLRLLAARTDDDRVLLTLTFSYLQVDGWTLGLITHALLALHDEEVTATPATITPSRPFADYVNWTRRPGAGAASQAFWREALAGVSDPTPLLASVPGNEPGRSEGLARRHLYLRESTTRMLRDAARRHRVTFSALTQAAWATLLSSYTGRTDVVLGAFLNGRSAAMAGIDAVAGPTMSVAPVRVDGLADERPLAEVLQELLRVAGEIVPHEQVDPSMLARDCGLDAGQQLFESYLVIQNLDPASFQSDQRITPFFSRMSHPIRIDVFPAVELGLALSYDRAQLDDDSAGRVLSDLTATLEAIAQLPDPTVGELRARLDLQAGSWASELLAWGEERAADAGTVVLGKQVGG